MSIPDDLIEETERRVNERARDREEHLQKLRLGKWLEVDTPDRIRMRFRRLGLETPEFGGMEPLSPGVGTTAQWPSSLVRSGKSITIRLQLGQKERLVGSQDTTDVDFFERMLGKNDLLVSVFWKRG
jgi:hypothetical protein